MSNTDMSPDGREVWDWADRMSDRVQRADQAKRLRAQINNMQNQCGNCTMWMTDSCPRERHDNRKGHKVGPSSQAQKCDRFTMSGADTKRLEIAQAKYAEIVKGLA